MVTIVEDYLTDRGRRRQRTVSVDLAAIRAEFTAPSSADLADWEQVRSELRPVVGESTFELWLADVQVVATDSAWCLVLDCPSDKRSWVVERYGRILERTGRSVGRRLRVATDRERQLLQALTASPHDDCTAHTTPPFPHPITHHHHKEAV
jgi:hypothetical protein